MIGVFLVYSVLGFLFYEAIFAAVAVMSSKEAEARQAQGTVTMLYAILAVVSVMAMMTEPNENLFIVLTMVPVSSPIAVPGRWVVGHADIRVIEFSAVPAACAGDCNVDCRPRLSNRPTHSRKTF